MTKSATLHLWAVFYPKSGANAVEDVGMVIHVRKNVIHGHKHRIQAQCGKHLREAVISDFFSVMCYVRVCTSLPLPASPPSAIPMASARMSASPSSASSQPSASLPASPPSAIPMTSARMPDSSLPAFPMTSARMPDSPLSASSQPSASLPASQPSVSPPLPSAPRVGSSFDAFGIFIGTFIPVSALMIHRKRKSTPSGMPQVVTIMTATPSSM